MMRLIVPIFCLLIECAICTVDKSIIGKRYYRRITYQYTWVFPIEQNDDDDLDSLFAETNLDITSDDPIGFIRLEGNDELLRVNLLKRPGGWTEGEPFCSPMVKAAVVEFYRQTDLRISKLKQLSVTNLAEPHEAGCRCYLRLMLAMGFDTIQESRSPTHSDVSSFCQSDDVDTVFLDAEAMHAIPHLPETDLKSQQALEAAYLERVEILPFNHEPLSEYRRKGGLASSL